MRSAVKARTPNFGFALINFNFITWHDTEHTNWRMVDALLTSIGATSVRGAWANNVSYEVGDRVVDAETSQIYVTNVDHVSSPTGSFADERTANPAYWSVVSSLPVYRGAWQATTGYSTGDIVLVSPNAYYFCISAHTSSGTFAEDIALWTLTFDAQPSVDLMNFLLSEAEDALEDTITARDITTAAEAATLGYRDDTIVIHGQVVTLRNEAATSAGNASASEIVAVNSATASSNSAGASAASATNSANSATASNTSANASQVSRIASEAARDKSQQWATNPEDNPVEPGAYSAYHWSAKALYYAGQAALFDPANFYTKTVSDARYYTKGETYTRGEMDGRYVNAAGDTMSGNLTISGAWPTVGLHYPGVYHWVMQVASDGNLNFVDSSGSGVKASMRPSGIFYAPSTIYAGNAQYATDGNIFGTTWGGWISTWITNQFSARDGAIADRVHRVGYGDWGESGIGVGWHDFGAKYICAIAGSVVAPYYTTVRTLRVYQHVPGLGGWGWTTGV